jgi:hypothetical protein
VRPRRGALADCIILTAAAEVKPPAVCGARVRAPGLCVKPDDFAVNILLCDFC